MPDHCDAAAMVNMEKLTAENERLRNILHGRLNLCVIAPTTDHLTAALKYLGWQGGTVHQVLAEIEVSFEDPPIPDRRFDYLAQFKGQEDGPQGWGRTREEAIIDLLDEVEVV